MVFFVGYWSVGVAVRLDQLLTQNYRRAGPPTRADILDFDSIIQPGFEDIYPECQRIISGWVMRRNTRARIAVGSRALVKY
jgi:hypothetical protein